MTSKATLDSTWPGRVAAVTPDRLYFLSAGGSTVLVKESTALTAASAVNSNAGDLANHLSATQGKYRLYVHGITGEARLLPTSTEKLDPTGVYSTVADVLAVETASFVAYNTSLNRPLSGAQVPKYLADMRNTAATRWMKARRPQGKLITSLKGGTANGGGEWMADTARPAGDGVLFLPNGDFAFITPPGYQIVVNTVNHMSTAEISSRELLQLWYTGDPWGATFLSAQGHSIGYDSINGSRFDGTVKAYSGVNASFATAQLVQDASTIAPSITQMKMLGLLGAAGQTVLTSMPISLKTGMRPSPYAGVYWYPTNYVTVGHLWVPGDIGALVYFDGTTALTSTQLGIIDAGAPPINWCTGTPPLMLVGSDVLAQAVKNAVADTRYSSEAPSAAEANEAVLAMEQECTALALQFYSPGILAKKMQKWHSVGSDLKDSFKLKRNPTSYTVGDFNREWPGKRLYTFGVSMPAPNLSTPIPSLWYTAKLSTRVLGDGTVPVVVFADYGGAQTARGDSFNGNTLSTTSDYVLRPIGDQDAIYDQLIADGLDDIAEKLVGSMSSGDGKPLSMPFVYAGMDADSECENFISTGAFLSKDMASAVLFTVQMAARARFFDTDSVTWQRDGTLLTDTIAELGYATNNDGSDDVDTEFASATAGQANTA